MNNAITEIKNMLKGTKRRRTVAEWISELENIIVEINAEEQNKGKRMKINQYSLRNYWNNIKCTNI